MVRKGPKTTVMSSSSLHYLESIKTASGTAAYGLVKYYTGNNTGDVPGNLPDPYYCKSPKSTKLPRSTTC